MNKTRYLFLRDAVHSKMTPISGTAIARTYRAEQRARADLEALIETSPVGVVVFDVGTGRPVSLSHHQWRAARGHLHDDSIRRDARFVAREGELCRSVGAPGTQSTH